MSGEKPRPLVSVVIAAYKSDYLNFSAAIDSALNQTYSNIEVLVVDDSPSDCLLKIVRDCDDPRIQYYHNNPALGVARNHWKGFERAQGEFIAILNHDDWYYPEFIDTLVEQMLGEPSAVLAFCDHFVIDSSGQINTAESDAISKRYGRYNLFQGLHRPFFRLVVSQTIPMAMGCIFRKNALPSMLPMDAGPSYDFWLTYLLARGGGGACYVPQRLSIWRCHEGNLTSIGGLDWLEGSAKCWKAIARDPAFVHEKSIATRNASARYLSCAVKSWREGRIRSCVCMAFQSLFFGLSFNGIAALLLKSIIPRGLSIFSKY